MVVVISNIVILKDGKSCKNIQSYFVEWLACTSAMSMENILILVVNRFVNLCYPN